MVHNIKLSFDSEVIVCSGGELIVLDDWTPNNEALTAVQYTYEIPAKSDLSARGTN